MSILIKGIDLPKDHWVKLTVCHDGTAMVWDGIEGIYNEFPVVELPPHGDLIDRGTFDERVREAVGLADEDFSDDFKDGVSATLDLLKRHPVIVPRE